MMLGTKRVAVVFCQNGWRPPFFHRVFHQPFSSTPSREASPKKEKKRVVILGTGWGGNKVARGLDKSIYDVRVISPSNHFLFTSFLPSTTVGTLEFRAVQEPIRTCEGYNP